MAQLPTQKRINREDLKNAPAWVDALIGPLNSFMESIYSAINKNLTFGDNIQGQIRTIEFTTSSTYTSSNTWTNMSFSSGLRAVKPKGVLVLQILEQSSNFTPVMKGVTIDWLENSGIITIYFVSGLKNSTTYSLTVLVL